MVTDGHIVVNMATSEAPSGHFSVLYFASAASFTARSSEHLPAPLEASKLFAALEERHPGITDKVLSSCAVTVNLEYVDVDGEEWKDDGDGSWSNRKLVINEGDEVAIIPPVSSG
jgi:molybdopterin converting factor small subunit